MPDLQHQRRFGRRFGRRFATHRLALVAAVVLVLVTAFAVLGPLFWSAGYTIHRSMPRDVGPTLKHPFGTDAIGHDLMGQVMRGCLQSLRVGAVAAVVSTGLGMVVGALAGYRRGWIDAILMRCVDVVLIVPAPIVLLALAGHAGGAAWWHIAVVVGLFASANTARVIRAIVLSLRESGYVDAALGLGASDRRVIGQYLLPNVIGAITVEAGFVFTAAVLAESALSFLGFGIAPPDTSLGDLVAAGQTAALTQPWLFYIPGSFLIIICICVNLVADGLRDAASPPTRMPAPTGQVS